MPPNLPLFLHYTRFGHFSGIRHIAIEGLLLLDGFAEPKVTAYLAKLVLYDSEISVRYFTARSLFNFSVLCSQKIDTGFCPEVQKRSFEGSLKIIADTWIHSKWYTKLT